MLKTIINTKYTYWIIFLYLIVLVWWFKLQSSGIGTNEAYIFNWFYGLIALSGAVMGIYISINKWGGWSSMIGRSLIMLSVGLIGQWFGLQVWTYYNITAQVEIPYPSLADWGYFALIPAYSYAAWLLAQASGAKFSLKTSGGRISAFLIPLTILIISYGLFLKDIGIDVADPMKTFLDIAYPLGEIIPVSIALFTLTLSRNLLGGVMRSRVLYLVGAFFFQFLTEYVFLYRTGLDLYINGGFSDLMYATSYAIMAIGIISFKEYE